jgi:L,D-transpeptidase catalytic domain
MFTNTLDSVNQAARRDGTAGGAAGVLVVALAVIVAASGCGPARHSIAPPPPIAPPPTPSIADRVAQYGPSARARLLPYFAAAGVPYPPARFLLLGLKHERELQLYAAGPAQAFAFIRSFAVLGASGELGPKLREGDRQVPEGVYRIEYLNPNSIAHLSLALSYPNPFDRMHAEEDGREDAVLGGDIMIHGGADSVGCLAVGNNAAEDLFVLAADADWEHAVVLISPVDFRRAALPGEYRPAADWVSPLYGWLRTQLRLLPLPPHDSGAKASRR